MRDTTLWAPQVRSLSVAFFLATGFGGCAEEHKLEDTKDSDRGLSQPGNAGGPLLDEDEACQRMEAALQERSDGLKCKDVEIGSCPSLIRPAASLACVRYTEESVDACVERVEGYKSCGDFRTKACIVSAVVDEKSEGCIPPSAPGNDAGLDAGSAEDMEPELDSGAAPKPPNDPSKDAAADAAAAPGELTDASASDAG